MGCCDPGHHGESLASTGTLPAVQPPGRTNFGCRVAPKQSFPSNFYPGLWLPALLPKMSEEF